MKRSFQPPRLSSLLGVVVFCWSGVLSAVEPSTSADPLAPWKTGVKVSAVSGDDHHSIHAYFNTSPESPDGRQVLFYASTTAKGYDGEDPHPEARWARKPCWPRGVAVEDAHRAACQQWVSGGGASSSQPPPERRVGGDRRGRPDRRPSAFLAKDGNSRSANRPTTSCPCTARTGSPASTAWPSSSSSASPVPAAQACGNARAASVAASSDVPASAGAAVARAAYAAGADTASASAGCPPGARGGGARAAGDGGSAAASGGRGCGVAGCGGRGFASVATFRAGGTSGAVGESAAAGTAAGGGSRAPPLSNRARNAASTSTSTAVSSGGGGGAAGAGAACAWGCSPTAPSWLAAIIALNEPVAAVHCGSGSGSTNSAVTSMRAGLNSSAASGMTSASIALAEVSTVPPAGSPGGCAPPAASAAAGPGSAALAGSGSAALAGSGSAALARSGSAALARSGSAASSVAARRGGVALVRQPGERIEHARASAAAHVTLCHAQVRSGHHQREGALGTDGEHRGR